MFYKKGSISLAILLLISGCGGGGSNSPITEPIIGVVDTSPYINDIVISNVTLVDYSIYGTNKSYYFRSGVLADLNNDGKNEFVLSVTSYPEQVPIPLLVLGDQSGSLNLTNQYFTNGAPTLLHSPWIHYVDINGDGKKDIIAAEAGLDAPPWTGSKIGVAINNGNTFTNITNQLPNNTSRSYAIAVGNFDGTGVTKVLLPAQESNVVAGTSMLLSFTNGVQTSPNPISSWVENDLQKQTSMVTKDFNNDGYDDLLVSGDWTGRNNAIIYGSKNGLDIKTLNTLPAGPFGQGGFDYAKFLGTQIIHSSEVNSISVDLNNDGKPDIFSVHTHVISSATGTITYEDSAFSVLINNDGYKFSLTSQSLSNNFGYRYYFNLIPYDINSDGKMDIIGHYFSTKEENWGTTFFINDGTGTFNLVEGKEMFPQLLVNNQIGAIIPVSKTDTNLTGIQFVRKDKTGVYIAQKFTTSQLKKLSVTAKK
jgi:hypothetical protein